MRGFAATVIVFGLLAACTSGPPVPTPSSATGATPAAPTASATSAPSAATPATSSTPAGSSSGPGGTGWGDSAGPFGGVEGDRFLFQCPPEGRGFAIWGTDIYTSDSSVCTAGVHAGLITFAAGGNITIEIRAGQTSYVGSTRNGVTSTDYASWDSSFSVIGGFVAPSEGPASSTPPPSGSTSPELEALLAHVPEAQRQNCTETTSFDTGVLISTQCLPDGLEGYVSYDQFDSVDNQRNAFFDQVDFFGEGADGDDCQVGPSQVIYDRAGTPAGRLVCNDYTDGPIAFWTREDLMISGFLQLFEGSYLDLYNTWLAAGPE